ncbi:MAG: ABC transporter substrate-binding protein [Bradyrhizobium sp.]
MTTTNRWHGVSRGAMLAGITVGAMLGGMLSAEAQDTVTIGQSTTMSGPIAELGVTGVNGIQMAVDAINASGGLLGKHVKLVTADDHLSPATGTSNIRNMILSDKAVAIFGPVASSIGVAEATVAGQYKTPFFTFTSNDIKMTTTNFTKYTFQLVPNTVMEPRAIAKFLAAKVGKKPITISTITPNYSFGRDTVDALLKALKADGVNYTVKAQQTPPLGATQYTSYIATLLASPADYTFIGEYGGDLITLTKQAKGFGFFKKTHAMGFYDRAQLMALKGQVPAGIIAWDRAPFWAMKGPGMQKFNDSYHKKYNEWPSAWAILGYASVQAWADGVKKAGSFSADKVVAALSGATMQVIYGPVTLRACDHQADVPEYIGTVAAKIDPRYGFQIYSNTQAIPASEVMLTCKEAKALQPGG